MSPQEDILTEIKNSIEGSTELIALLAPLTVNTFGAVAEEGTPCPYFVYKFQKQKNLTNGLGDGILKISIWFYSAHAGKAYNAEDILVRLLDEKTLQATTIRDCRIWHLGEERKESVKKDYIKDNDAINIELQFYMRWISLPRSQPPPFPY